MPSKSRRAIRPPRVPSYCLHRGSGQAYVKVCGRVTYLGAYGTPASRSAYAAAVSDVLCGRGVVPPKRSPSERPAGLTVREVCERFVAHAEGYYRKNGVPTSEASIVAGACRRAAQYVGARAAATA